MAACVTLLRKSSQPSRDPVSLLELRVTDRLPIGEQPQTSQLLLQEPTPAFPPGPEILEAIARQPLLESSSSQSYLDGPDSEQQRKAKRAQAQRLRRAAQSAEQRAAVAAADAARHAAARYASTCRMTPTLNTVCMTTSAKLSCI